MRGAGILLGIAAAALVVAAGAAPARAQQAQITIGLFAPTAPFSGPSDRLEFIRGLADHLASQTGMKVTGRVFAGAGAFASAVKKGELQFAVVDAPYAAAIGLPYEMLGAAVRGDSAVSSWQVVSSGSVRSLSDLRGKNVAIPSTGAKESAFLTNVLLDGEVDAGYFGKVSSAPDALSAVTMVSAGRADAAFVPGGLDLPGGVSRALTVSTVGWPMFVALPAADKALVDRFGKAARSYSGSGTFSRFTSADAGQYRKLDFGRPARRGPMAVPPPARLSVRDILVGRVFKIELSDVLLLAEAPVL